MDDEELERRLRRDPTMDPPHEAGAFRDRLAERAIGGQSLRQREGARIGAPLAVAAMLLVIAALVGGRVGPPAIGPGSTSSTATIAPLPSGRLQGILIDWAHRGPIHRATLAVIGPTGETWTGASAGSGEAALDPLSTYRIGEMSRMLLVSGVMSLDECGRGVGEARCPVPTIDPPFRIDDRLSRWIPGWPNADAITLRQLLDGTSGLAPVTTGIADLVPRVAADPTADWTQAALISRARALPPSFAPGTGFAITDTADLLLDEIVARATARPSLFWIGSSAVGHFGLASTTLAGEPPEGLVAGTLADGTRLADLPTTVLTAIGNSSGVASSALDLARYASPAWSTTSIHDPSTIAAVTAVANDHSYGLGVRGLCPCPGGRPTILGLSGHAAAWSGIVAKDTVGGWSVALLVDSDLTDAELEAVLAQVLAAQFG